MWMCGFSQVRQKLKYRMLSKGRENLLCFIYFFVLSTKKILTNLCRASVFVRCFSRTIRRDTPFQAFQHFQPPPCLVAGSTASQDLAGPFTHTDIISDVRTARSWQGLCSQSWRGLSSEMLLLILRSSKTLREQPSKSFCLIFFSTAAKLHQLKLLFECHSLFQCVIVKNKIKYRICIFEVASHQAESRDLIKSLIG